MVSIGQYWSVLVSISSIGQYLQYWSVYSVYSERAPGAGIIDH